MDSENVNALGDAVVYGVAAIMPIAFAVPLWLLAKRHARRQGLANKATSARYIIIANLLVFGLVASLVFLLGETYYRYLADWTESFAQTRVTQRWFDRHYHRNNAAFRDNVAYEFSRSGRKRRVSFIGDSFTAGHGIANVDDRFANQVRQLKGSQWEVHVLAEVGRDTGAEIKLVQDLVRSRYEFDIVVLVYCLNDINDLVAANAPRATSPPGPSFLVKHSFFINTLYFRLKGMVDPDVANYYGSLRSAYEGPLWEEQKERLIEFKRVCETAGGRVVAVTFPFVHSLDPDYEYRPVHERLDEFWEDQGVAHLDLLPVLQTQASDPLTVNSRDAHPNEHAHAIAARAIVGFLEKHLR